MYSTVAKPKKTESRAVESSDASKKANVKQGFGFTDNRPESIALKELQFKINGRSNQPIQLMKKWTQAGGFEDIEEAPVGGGWLRCKYKGEEIYISDADMAHFAEGDWGHIEYYSDSGVESDGEYDAKDNREVEDKYPNLKDGEVISITIIKESRSDHQYVIVMVKGGGNIKMHYGTNGGLYEKSDGIDNEHGIPVAEYKAPDGLTGDKVTQIFESTKDEIEKKFTGGNCGALASELVGKLGGIYSGDFDF